MNDRIDVDTPIPPVVAAAVVAACAELSNLKRDQTATVETRSGGTYSYAYNDLADVVELTRPILARHGLAMIQPVTRQLGAPLVIETWLLHESGHMLRWSFEVNGDGGPQAMGSAITYARRYCGQAVLGIASEGVDDDGQTVERARPPRPTRAATRTTTSTARLETLKREVFAILGGLNIRDRETRLQLAGQILNREIDTFDDLTAIEWRRIRDEIRERQNTESEVEVET